MSIILGMFLIAVIAANFLRCIDDRYLIKYLVSNQGVIHKVTRLNLQFQIHEYKMFEISSVQIRLSKVFTNNISTHHVSMPSSIRLNVQNIIATCTAITTHSTTTNLKITFFANKPVVKTFLKLQ